MESSGSGLPFVHSLYVYRAEGALMHFRTLVFKFSRTQEL
jgi:hypothetical protein